MDYRNDPYMLKRVRAAEEQAAGWRCKAEGCRREAEAIALRIGGGERVFIGVIRDDPFEAETQAIRHLLDTAKKAEEKALRYESRAAEFARNDAIYNDDPRALEKIEERIMELSEGQRSMVAVNRLVRTRNKLMFLELPGATEEMWQALITPNILGQTGISQEKLRYNNRQLVYWKQRKTKLLERTAVPPEGRELTTLFIPVIKSMNSNENHQRTPETANTRNRPHDQALP